MTTIPGAARHRWRRPGSGTATTALRAATTGCFVIGAVLCLFPFYWVLALATHSTAEIVSGFPLLPGDDLGENFSVLQARSGIFIAFFNSMYITAASTTIALLCSSLGGYAFARYAFPGKNLLFIVVLATMMIPVQMGLVAFVKLMSFLGLYNTHIPLIAQLGTPFGIFWMTQYIREFVHDEMINAARIEGAGELAIFARVVLPICTPAIVSLAIIRFVNTWNAYLIPLVLLQEPSRFTLPMAIAAIQGKHQILYGARFLATAVGTLPLIAMFLLAARRVIDSIATGAVKG